MDDGRLPPTDATLAGKARHGDQGACHTLVDRYAGYLYGIAASMTGNDADAEDILQETFAGAFRGLGRFRGQAAFKTWLTQILVRQVAGHFRRSRGRNNAAVPLDADVPDRAGAPGDGSDARMDVNEAIRALRPEHREVIVLRELHGLSYQEISTVLMLPRGTVESRLFRARRELQMLLKDYLP